MNGKTRNAGRFLASLIMASAASFFAPPSARADASPGDVITAANIDKAKELISPGLEWCIRHGWPLRVAAYKKIDLPEAYRAATEKFAGSVQLAPDARTLQNYVAGQPFPKLDPNDPQIAIKIMWNYEYKPTFTDDVDARNFDSDTGPIDGKSPMSIERHFLLDHLRYLRYVGRLYNEPKPLWQTTEGYQAKALIYPIVEPFDLKGVGGLTYRFLDPAKQDETWLYLPSLRRVRRLSSSQRSDALFGQDADIDSFLGYAGQVAWMDWKYLGERQMLGVYHAENYPVKWASGGADFGFDDVWEKRTVYVIEGVSKLAQYSYGKRVLFIDKETFTVTHSDIYDKAGQLWKVWINGFSFRKLPFAGATLSVYADEMAFTPAVVMVDAWQTHATKVALPSHRFPGEEGWYFNLADKSGTKENLFTIPSLIDTGH